jgi:hypothetical protein
MAGLGFARAATPAIMARRFTIPIKTILKPSIIAGVRQGFAGLDAFGCGSYEWEP